MQCLLSCLKPNKMSLNLIKIFVIDVRIIQVERCLFSVNNVLR